MQSAGKRKGLVVGLTGGVAAGKSTVASMLAEKGAGIVDFDRLAREIARPGMPALAEIAEIFGPSVIGEGGELDRKALGRLVFADRAARKRLEAVTHPRIFELYRRRAGRIFDRKPDAVLVAVIPLLMELGLEGMFDVVVLVYAPPDVQVKRLMSRDRLSAGEAERILGSQMPIDEKVPRARFVIDNSGSLRETRLQVDELWRGLQAMPRGGRGPDTGPPFNH